MEVRISILLFLELADLDDAFRSLIQQAQNFVIDEIDLFPILGKVFGHSHLSLFPAKKAGARPSAGMAQAKWEMIQEPFLAMQGDHQRFTNLRDDLYSVLNCNKKDLAGA
jgi:hypothetical protein